jgi:hypothetical protein
MQWRKNQKLIGRIFDFTGVFHALITALKSRPQPLLTSVVFTMQTARLERAVNYQNVLLEAEIRKPERAGYRTTRIKPAGVEAHP